MGIHGLTTFISQNSLLFLESFRLHDCHLVIDGNSLASKLYLNVCKGNCTFGGEYDIYHSVISNFFTLLSKCNIIPLVVIDGGYETRKLKTVESRMKAKLQAARSQANSFQPNAIVFPLLLKEAFKQALRDIGIKFVQVDFEADYEVAALARQLNCPVLSQDSDFYVCDVLYIPFSTLNLHVTKSKKQSGSTVRYLKCEIFQTDRLVKYFGGLDKSLLPLMGTLLGNDYVSISIFEKFYDHIKLPNSKKMSVHQRRICAVFEWLRRESLESAVAKIIGRFKKEARRQILNEIQRSLSAYHQCSSDLLQEFNLTKELPSNILSHQDTNSCSVMKNECSTHEDSECSCSVNVLGKCGVNIVCVCKKDWQVRKPTPPTWPKWLVEMFRGGNLPAFVSDLYYLQIFFCQPQVEDFSLADSHIISFPILRVSYSILINSITQTSESHKSWSKPLTCLSRVSGIRVSKFELEPISKLPFLSPFPPLASLPLVPIYVRKQVLLSVLGFENDKDVEMLMLFPDNWILFAMVIGFWGRNSLSPQVDSHKLHAVILTWVILGVVECTLKMSCSGNIDQVSKENKTDRPAHKDIHLIESPKDVFESGNTLQSSLVKDSLSAVSVEDCQLLIEKLSQFRTIRPKHLRGNKHVSMLILHSLAQLQTCLQQAMALNSILYEPFPQVQLSNTYSGSLSFSVYMSIHNNSNVKAFMKSLLKDSDSVAKLYESLIHSFELILPDLTVPLRKLRRRKKYCGQEPNVSSSEDQREKSEEESEIVLDTNNKFSVLSLL